MYYVLSVRMRSRNPFIRPFCSPGELRYLCFFKNTLNHDEQTWKSVTILRQFYIQIYFTSKVNFSFQSIEQSYIMLLFTCHNLNESLLQINQSKPLVGFMDSYYRMFNPLSANATEFSNTLKQFVGNSRLFDHFVGLALKGLRRCLCDRKNLK